MKAKKTLVRTLSFLIMGVLVFSLAGCNNMFDGKFGEEAVKEEVSAVLEKVEYESFDNVTLETTIKLDITENGNTLKYDYSMLVSDASMLASGQMNMKMNMGSGGIEYEEQSRLDFYYSEAYMYINGKFTSSISGKFKINISLDDFIEGGTELSEVLGYLDSLIFLMDEGAKVYIDDSAKNTIKIKYVHGSISCIYVFEHNVLAGVQIKNDEEGSYMLASYKKTTRKIVLPDDLDAYEELAWPD